MPLKLKKLGLHGLHYAQETMFLEAKYLGGHARKSKNRIKRALCTAAMSLCNSKCSLGAYYRRMAARIGKSKALKAVAHKLARLIYQLLKNGQAYVEIGQEEYEEAPCKKAQKFDEKRP